MNLDELKKKLLEALPPALREKLGFKAEMDDDEDVDGDEVTSSHDIPSEDKTDVHEVGEEEEDDEEAQKKAQRSKIIRIVAILAVVYFAADEFLLNDESDELVIPPPPTRPNRPPRPPAEPVAETTPEAVATPEVRETAPPVEVVEETPEPIFEPEETPEPIAEVPPETPPQVLPESTPEQVEEMDWSAQMGQQVPELEATKSPDEFTEAKPEKNLSQMIERPTLERDDPSYIAPPNYTRTGRGLVYNCKEGHWACVDKFSYFTCYENQRWNRLNSKPTECVTRDVYATVQDCSAIQKFYVNKPEKTDFCGQSEKPTDETTPVDLEEDLSNIIAP